MRKHMLLTALFSIFIVLAACGSGETNEVDEGPGAADEKSPPVENDDLIPGEDDGAISEGDNGAANENDATEPEGDQMTETGIYNGQADPHTIEIETEDGPKAFQLTMEARDDVDALTVGGKVTYTYYEDGEQLVIEKIEPAE